MRRTYIQKKEGVTINFDDKEDWHLNHLNSTQALNAIATIAVILFMMWTKTGIGHLINFDTFK